MSSFLTVTTRNPLVACPDIRTDIATAPAVSIVMWLVLTIPDPALILKRPS